MALKLNVNMKNLLKSNNWSKMIQNSEYNRLNREMFYNILKIANVKNA
jgi:hypothetical protein